MQAAVTYEMRMNPVETDKLTVVLEISMCFCFVGFCFFPF